MLVVIVTLGLLAAGVLHWVLSRREPAWLGGLVPLVLLVLVGYAVAAERLPFNLWTVVVTAFALLTLAQMWGEGRKATAARTTARSRVSGA